VVFLLFKTLYKKNVKIFELLDFPKNKDYFYKDLPGVISPYDHTQLAQMIYACWRKVVNKSYKVNPSSSKP
jgi:hypothetical protein